MGFIMNTTKADILPGGHIINYSAILTLYLEFHAYYSMLFSEH